LRRGLGRLASAGCPLSRFLQLVELETRLVADTRPAYPRRPFAAAAHVLEAFIETLKAENESLKRQLANAEKRVARETAKAEGAITESSAIARRLMARAAERASRG
jgi:hypothetical protein